MSKEKNVFGTAKEILTTNTDVKLVSKGIDSVSSVIFEKLGVSLQKGDGPLSQVLVFSLEIPVETDKIVAGYTQDISFGVERSNGTRVLIAFDLAGTLHSVEYPFQADFTKEPPASIVLGMRRFFSPQGVESASQNNFGLLGVKSYLATVYVSVQRRSYEDFVLVSVDGIDIAAVLI